MLSYAILSYPIKIEISQPFLPILTYPIQALVDLSTYPILSQIRWILSENYPKHDPNILNWPHVFFLLENEHKPLFGQSSILLLVPGSLPSFFVLFRVTRHPRAGLLSRLLLALLWACASFLLRAFCSDHHALVCGSNRRIGWGRDRFARVWPPVFHLN